MPSMDAATGNFVSAKEHYDLLLAEGNDPVLDPPALADYMNGWDGVDFLDMLCLNAGCRVLEIGVGTGRLALRILGAGCASYTGMDLSESTLRRAGEHLAGFGCTALIAGEFPTDAPEGPFDRICSSLTFLHIQNKAAAVRKIAQLLAEGGRTVISLDKEQSNVLDMAVRQVRTYPDDPFVITALMESAGLRVLETRETERAWLIAAGKC